MSGNASASSVLSFEVHSLALGIGQLGVLGRVRHEQVEAGGAAGGARSNRVEQRRRRGGHPVGDDQHLGRIRRRRRRSRCIGRRRVS